MRVLHLLAAGGTGGIESLTKNYATHSKHTNYFVFVYDGGDLAEEMRACGNGVLILPKNLGNIARIKAMAEYCYNNNIDVVVSHHSSPVLKLTLYYIKKKTPTVKAIAYAHANAKDICEYKKRGVWIRKKIHKLGFSVADKIIAISESVKNSLVDYLNVKEDKIQVIYNGTSINSDKPTIQSFKTPLRVIYVGRLTKDKGVHTTIEALAGIKEKDNYRFTIVGDGAYRKDLENKVKENKLENIVQFLGTRKDVPELLSNADVFVHTPEWEEGFGITVIEAMSAGVLCVCSEKGALPEIIQNNVNGFLVEPNSVHSLRDKLTEIFTDYKQHNSYEDIRKTAVVDVQKYSIEKFAEKLDREIEMV